MTLPLEYIPYVDIVLLVLLIILMITGFARGFLLSLIDLVGTFVMLLIAYFVSPILAANFSILTDLTIDVGVEALNLLIVDRINQLFWFVVVFVIGQVVILFLKPVVKVVCSIPLIKQINQILGLVLGAVKGYILALILIFVLSTPLITNGRVFVENTVLSKLEESSVLVLELLEDPKEINEILQNIINGNIISEEEKAELLEWLTSLVSEEELMEIFKSLSLE
ncbi:MAG: CvpA family protein [Erysipelotrichaceae bacterium]|nr:CvpA family protein [Erysipelotrichaceae bacterium]MBR3694123.1 CvpA family protein [Erysipelotrichales bacterium]